MKIPKILLIWHCKLVFAISLTILQHSKKDVFSEKEGPHHFGFDIINIEQVNEGFESEIKPKKIHHNSIEQNIDENNEGKKQFFLS